MAVSLTHEQIDDFVAITLNNFKKRKWVDISMPLQIYHFAERWFEAKKKAEKGGPRLEWKLRVGNQGTARHSGLFAIDDTNRVNVLTTGKQEWAKTTVNYIFDVDEGVFQQGPQMIIDEMVLHEQGLYNDFYELMETDFWSAPASSTQSPRPTSGVPFWLQRTATLGFNGGDPSGFSSGAGQIPTATYPKWKNYGGTYTQIDRDDAIENIINAMDFCHFRAPRKYPEIGGGLPDWGLYTVHSVLATARKMLQDNNDNLGNDVAARSGEVLVRSTPLDWVPALGNTESDAYDATAPIYGVNWNKFYYFFQQGRNMVKQPPFRSALQHTVRERHMDNWGNTVCYDRRQAGFVFYAA